MRETIINNFIKIKFISYLYKKLIIIKSRYHIKKKSKIYLNKFEKISNKKLWLVYDFKTSPISYGDSMHLIILSRYLSLKFNKIIIYYITGELRNDYIEEKSQYNDRDIFNKFHKKLFELTNKLKKNNCEIKNGSWEEFSKIVKDDKFIINNYIFEKNKIMNRISIYKDFFLYINFLLFFDKEKLDDTIFDFKKIKIDNNKFKNFKNKKYISFHCRFSDEGSQEILTIQSL